jgi:hypothetical protein
MDKAPLPFPNIHGWKVLYLPLIGAGLAVMITAYRWLWWRAVGRKQS